MVHCIDVGCGSKSGKHKVGFHTIPKIVSNQGQEHEERTRERRTRWIAAISREDAKTKGVLDSERVCGRHFVSGRAAKDWDVHNIDWVPTLNLGKKQFKKPKESDAESAKARGERVKERRKRELERQEIEAAKKRKELNQSGLPIQEIDFTSDIASTASSSSLDTNLNEPSFSTSCDGGEETDEISVQADKSASTDDIEIRPKGTRDTETQTEEFDYMFSRFEYRAPDKDFFNSSEKVRFYTGLPSYEVLMVVFDHVAPHVPRRHGCTTLNRFQEFVMVLMKLRLNVPFQDLAYRFVLSLSSVSRIFTSWIIAMDLRLSCFIHWPDREQLWKTMPMCFQYTFGRKVTVIIDCFEVFINKPTNLLARAQTFSSYKNHNTIKVLIGITQQGTVSFVSEAWGGRTSEIPY